MKQKIIFFLYLIILILPNLILCYTESIPPSGKQALVLLPLGVYWTILSLSPRKSRTLWWMFPILFLGAFNIVLSYLFGKGVIAVDMWLNLTTSSPAEMGEMLSQIYPAVVAVVVIYLPTLIYATIDIARKTKLPTSFLQKQRIAGLLVLAYAIPLSIYASCAGKWKILDDLFPINVCYNLRLAVERQAKSEQYLENSQDFCFNSVATDTDSVPKIVVLVIGETGRACNWQLNGYHRETTPLLSKNSDIIYFRDCMSQSNTTHKSIPIILSPATANNFNALYTSKGLLAAYNEANYYTAFLSNQPRNNSFNDHLGEQAQEVLFLRDNYSTTPMDSLLLPEVQRVLDNSTKNLLLVVHSYGSHSTYSDRYERHNAHFQPDLVAKSTKENREMLLNAYDNTIRYTDRMLNDIIQKLDSTDRPAVMLYVSDHGEDIYDDNRNLFLHASPWPSYYQMHVPMFVWANEQYRTEHAQRIALLQSRTNEPIQTDCIFPTVLGLGGITTVYGQDSLSLTSNRYKTKEQRTYLNDHNEPLTFDKCLEEKDFQAIEKHKLRPY